MAASRLAGIVSASAKLYKGLLVLYPSEHRREYGPPMAQAFRDLAHDAWRRGGHAGLLRLWLRVLPDLARTAADEHVAAFTPGGAFIIENRPTTPLPWWQVALAVLPGLGVLADNAPHLGLPYWLASLRAPRLPAPIHDLSGLTLALSALLIVATLVWRRRFPVWGLPALGLLVGLWVPAVLAAVIYMLVTWRRQGNIPGWAWLVLAVTIGLSFVPISGGGPNVWGLLGVGATLLVALLGLPLARRHGPVAALGVAAAGFVLWEETFDLTYGLANTFWADAMVATLGLLLLLVAPICVLRARSVRWQAWGLLLPAAIALAGVATVNAIVRTDPAVLGLAALPGALDSDHAISYGSLGRGYLVPLLLRDGLTVVQVLTALVLTLVLYGRARVAETAPLPDQTQGARGLSPWLHAPTISDARQGASRAMAGADFAASTHIPYNP